MASATRVRDWATVDYYALLGIEPTADADDVTRAFRDQAKRSHPDAGHPDAGDDDEAASRFSDVAAAYAVLSDPGTRREYDRVRAECVVRTRNVPAPPVVAPRTPAARKPWTRQRASTVLVAGLAVFVLGVGAALLTWSMHANDARQRSGFVPINAVRLEVAGEPIVTFVTPSGERIKAPEPRRHGDPNGLSPTMKIRYNPADPQHVIVDSSTASRDITFTIVALKLLIGGAVFAGLGFWKLRSSKFGSSKFDATAAR